MHCAKTVERSKWIVARCLIMFHMIFTSQECCLKFFHLSIHILGRLSWRRKSSYQQLLQLQLIHLHLEQRWCQNMHHNACIILVGHSLWYVETNPTGFLYLVNKKQSSSENNSISQRQELNVSCKNVRNDSQWNLENPGGLMASNGWIFGQIEREGGTADIIFGGKSQTNMDSKKYPHEGQYYSSQHITT